MIAVLSVWTLLLSFTSLLVGCERVQGLVGRVSLHEQSSQQEAGRVKPEDGGGGGNASGPATIVIDSQVLHEGVKRLGMNLSGQSFYDSGQMLRNLTFRNPGFEGETWQSILRCKQVTATTCTDANEYAVWPEGFLNGARLEVISGMARGRTAIVNGMNVAGNGRGVTLELSAVTEMQAGDYVLVRIEKPGDAQAGWWPDLQGGATLETEFKDLSTHTAGRQALRVNAGQAGQTAVVNNYFDSLEGRSFVQLRGHYTVSFRAKAATPGAVLGVKVTRLDTQHGARGFLNKSVALTPAWQDYKLSFDAAEDGTGVGTVALSFTVAQANVLLDDAQLEAVPGKGNMTAFRDEVVATLRALRPGVLRYMDNGTDFGSSLDNMLAVPFARQRTGASTQAIRQEDVPLGLHEFLELCAAVGAEPWYTIPAGSSPAEAAGLVEYLAGDAGTHYGAIRAARGQKAAWTTVFPSIHLELGNEMWNARSFAGSTMDDPTAYGQRAAAVFAGARSGRGFMPEKFDLILGSWASVPWWSGQEMASSSGWDTLAVAPYQFDTFNDGSSPEAIFGPMFAEPEMLDSRAGGEMVQQAEAVRRAGPGKRLAVYETNLGVLSGSASQDDLDAAVPSLGAGLAVLDHMLLMLRDVGVTTQCLFALPEYFNYFQTTAGAKERVPLWGSVVDMGGPTGAGRPQFVAEALANEVILGRMLTTHIEGTPVIWDQAKGSNGEIALEGAHILQSFAFADGVKRSLIVLNLSRDKTVPVQFAGAERPTGLVGVKVLTANALTANNEKGIQVAVADGRSCDGSGYELAPFSMTTFTWTAAGMAAGAVQGGTAQ